MENVIWLSPHLLLVSVYFLRPTLETSISSSSGIIFISPPTLNSSGGSITRFGGGSSLSLDPLWTGRIDSVFALWNKLRFSFKDLLLGFPFSFPSVFSELFDDDNELELEFSRPNFFFRVIHFDSLALREDKEPDFSRGSEISSENIKYTRHSSITMANNWHHQKCQKQKQNGPTMACKLKAACSTLSTTKGEKEIKTC